MTMVQVRLYLGAIGGDLTADVPFKLCQLDPAANNSNRSIVVQQKRREWSRSVMTNDKLVCPVRKQFTREMSGDLVFEEFARRRQQSEDILE